jgi:DNA-binding response OmpR family regulator
MTASLTWQSHELREWGADHVLMKPFANESVVAWLQARLSGDSAWPC